MMINDLYQRMLVPERIKVTGFTYAYVFCLKLELYDKTTYK